MATDEALRRALHGSVQEILPDLDSELATVVGHAQRRRASRRALWAVALAAAVVVAAVVVNRVERAPVPQPADPPVTELTRNRGIFMSPSALAPGRYRVAFINPDTSGRPFAEIDVPTGWAQDDDVALATGAGHLDGTRRIEFVAEVLGLHPDPCSRQYVRPPTGAENIARALASMEGMRVTGPDPVTLGGHLGFRLRIMGPASARTYQSCPENAMALYELPSGRASQPHGWTHLIWLLDHEGRTLVIDASYGPGVDPAQVDELVRMVESVTIVDR